MLPIESESVQRAIFWDLPLPDLLCIGLRGQIRLASGDASRSASLGQAGG
jgi:hypothetical protein